MNTEEEEEEEEEASRGKFNRMFDQQLLCQCHSKNRHSDNVTLTLTVNTLKRHINTSNAL